MKTFPLLIAALACGSYCLADEPEFTIAATATLKDGSVIKADFLNGEIKGSTAFLNELTLKPEIVRSLTFTGTNGESKVTLVNSDLFGMTVADKTYKIKSALGELNIPVSGIRSLSFRKTTRGQSSNDGLIFYCTFDSTEAIQNPVVGPSAVFNKATTVPGKEENALLAQPYKPQAAYDLPANFFGHAGCIEFWAKIRKTSSSVGWGGDPRFFTVTRQDNGETFCTLDVVSNNGGGNSGFATWSIVGNIASIRGMRSLYYNDLFNGDWRDWHHYAIIWDANGLKGLHNADNRTVALLVDGEVTPCGKFDTHAAFEIEQYISGPSRLSFTHDPDKDHEHQTKSPFLIDEFKIWNYPKTEFDAVK